MKIFSATQIRKLDAYTIEHEPIKSIDLMERASLTFVDWFTQNFPPETHKISIFVGPGNNGGDGLAIARLLYFQFYAVQIFWCKIGNSVSEDFEINLKRLPKRNAVPLHEISNGDPLPDLSDQTLIIDAIFGSGLNRSVQGFWKDLIHHLNNQKTTIVSVDIPSGLFADQHSSGISIHADFTFSFELPKLAFLFPENNQRVGNWLCKSIGLDQSFIQKTETNNFYADHQLANSILKNRQKFDHKGTYGHALLMAGSQGKIGAAILAVKAALRGGAGLVSIHAPKCAYTILQSAVPEAMVSIDDENNFISKVPGLERFKSIGIGPGIDNNPQTINALKELIKVFNKPIVFDADALNILAQNQDLLAKLPKNSILTPHPKEFERLFGKTENDYDRNNLQRTKAEKLGVFIVLKGAHTCIATPSGDCYFNSTGNPGMATGGSGDVLTGLITSLLAQGYDSKSSSILGVYLHGLAADIALEETQNEESMIASDLINYFGKAFTKTR